MNTTMLGKKISVKTVKSILKVYKDDFRALGPPIQQDFKLVDQNGMFKIIKNGFTVTNDQFSLLCMYLPDDSIGKVASIRQVESFHSIFVETYTDDQGAVLDPKGHLHHFFEKLTL